MMILFGQKSRIPSDFKPNDRLTALTLLESIF